MTINKNPHLSQHTFEMNRSHYIELRLLLTCFYIYLNYHTLIYMKQVIFHYSMLTSPFTHPYLYIHIRAIVGGCISLTYRYFLVYALWRKMADLLLISIIFLITVLSLRFLFDIYGYSTGYIKQSLYYPFNSFDTKKMSEEIIDLIFALIRNSIGLAFSCYMFTNIIYEHRSEQTTNEINHRLSISE
ncbi:unnamed protein product [Adineta steineri]|uniref:Uncharacterized protein n=1 Tax=Adineta steineri TaxID=433720 RepID=A0A818X3U8_9BILA|nr:unnamed protein product [Adineta steineri]CAF3733529.1 unnamed protein product [Adineta steineri]